MKSGLKQFAQNAVLVVLSLAFALVLVRLVVFALSAAIADGGSALHDNELGEKLWTWDSACGYRNRPNVREELFGGVSINTNSLGFRSDTETAPRPAPEKLRIIGMGDSVAWGAGVNEEDTFLGVLRYSLKEENIDAEVINAAVVGYSTLQEYIFLEEKLASLHPDVVFINFCPNDWLPTENPFGNLAAVYAAFFRFIGRNEPDGRFSEVGFDVGLFLDKKMDAHDLAGKMEADQAYYRAAFDSLIRIPLEGIGRLAEHYGIRVVYVMIPVRTDKKRSTTYLAAMEAMRQNNIEYIDFFDQLKETGDKCGKLADFDKSLSARAAKRLGEAFGPLGLGFYRDLEKLSMARGLAETNSACNYLDDRGHLTRKGHRIVAEELFLRLKSDGLPVKAGAES